jgi:hypothetical protein
LGAQKLSIAVEAEPEAAYAVKRVLRAARLVGRLYKVRSAALAMLYTAVNVLDTSVVSTRVPSVVPSFAKFRMFMVLVAA